MFFPEALLNSSANALGSPERKICFFMHPSTMETISSTGSFCFSRESSFFIQILFSSRSSFNSRGSTSLPRTDSFTEPLPLLFSVITRIVSAAPATLSCRKSCGMRLCFPASASDESKVWSTDIRQRSFSDIGCLYNPSHNCNPDFVF